MIAQKIVSKVENRFVNLKTVKPQSACEYALKTDKVRAWLSSFLVSQRVIRHRKGVLVVENHQGLIMANEHRPFQC